MADDGEVFTWSDTSPHVIDTVVGLAKQVLGHAGHEPPHTYRAKLLDVMAWQWTSSNQIKTKRLISVHGPELKVLFGSRGRKYTFMEHKLQPSKCFRFNFPLEI